ncbi:hypothetical protein [Flavobacterium sp.]|uniref:hypothetical protein n=1 Tax=Flavobacterium sp. TaxID=239 RepID=UPI0037531E04
MKFKKATFYLIVSSFIVFLNCNQGKTTSQLSSNLFFENNKKKVEISEFDSSPKDYNLLMYKCISIEKNTTNYIQYTYQKGILKNRNIIKTLNNMNNTSKIFDNIPEKYLNKN